MIAFLPKIYEDELCYNWFGRYYCHSGYPTYGYALDDLFGKRTLHFNAEYISGRFSEDAKKVITDIVPMEKLILEHTMFPIVRFMDHQRMQKSLESMVNQEGKVCDLLPLPKSRNMRYLRYCPCCASEQREKFGEAFWTRTANINGLDICAKHKCRLKDTDILLSGKQAPRLHIAEMVIKDVEPEFVEDGTELKFVEYLTDVFQAPININNNINISDFLKSKLEGTKYLSVSGQQRNICMLKDDMVDFYRDLPDKGNIDIPLLQKVFTGYRTVFYEVCQIAFFLNVNVGELTSPILPKKSQSELFNEKVTELRAEGFSSKKIAQILGADPHSVQKVGKTREKAGYNHSARKGMTKENWAKVDEETFPIVKSLCQKLYHGEGDAPQKVTLGTVERLLKMPNKRLAYLPKCRNEISKYEESQEEFWARKVVWKYRQLQAEGKAVTYSSLTRGIHLDRDNFLSAFPFLFMFCKKNEEKRIRELGEG